MSCAMEGRWSSERFLAASMSTLVISVNASWWPSPARASTSASMPSIFSSWNPSACPTLTASLPSRMETHLGPSSASRWLPHSPVTADSPLRIELTTSLDQRSPHRLDVTLALSTAFSISAISSTRFVERPCGSPTRNTVCLSPPIGTVRLTWPAW